MTFINRLWTRAATYDGLAFAFTLWALLLFLPLVGVRGARPVRFEQHDIKNPKVLAQMLLHQDDGISQYLRQAYVKESHVSPVHARLFSTDSAPT